MALDFLELADLEKALLDPERLIAVSGFTKDMTQNLVRILMVHVEARRVRPLQPGDLALQRARHQPRGTALGNDQGVQLGQPACEMGCSESAPVENVFTARN